MQTRDRAHVLAVARGDAPADLVIDNAQVFCSFTKEWLQTSVSVARGHVAGLGPAQAAERIDAQGRWLVPGFIDAHVHLESSKLMFEEFARVVLAHGTTAVVADPHEIANVLGVDGVRWMLDVCSRLPLAVFAMVPSCVPASAFESPRGELTLEDMQQLLGHERVLGVAEMMNFPAVIAGEADEIAKVDLAHTTDGARVDGHAPGVTGRQLDAYIAAGITTDHEATTVHEALQKRRRGMWVLLRDASNARNLLDLLPMVIEHGTDRCAFCVDDREPDFLVEQGHINQMCREAVAHGLPVEDALVLASHNAALCHGLQWRGAIAPGYRADFMLLDDLTSFRPSSVYVDGRLVARHGIAVGIERQPVPHWARRSVHVADLGDDALDVPAPDGDIRVIGVIAQQLLTRELVMPPTVDGGLAVADPARDLCKIAVVERHNASGRIGVGFVQGFALQRGAFASTIAHDAHNIVVVGVDDRSMRTCIARIAELGGGVVACDGTQVVAELALPIAGLLSDAPTADVVSRLHEVGAALTSMGVQLPSPMMALSFLALSVIPELKITDRGLVDVAGAQLVSLAVS